MSYLSISFAAFVPMLLIIYYIVPKKELVRGTVLLIGSLFFYCCFDLRYLIFLIFTALSTFYCALLLPKTGKPKTAITLCIIVNVGAWFAVKVLPWVTSIGTQLLNSLGVGISLELKGIIVPVGISYFTLQALSYTIDVYKRKITPETSFIKYLLFVSYFPAIVQGPISRYDALMPQLMNKKDASFEVLRKGVFLILLGLIKKLVIADRLQLFVNSCFGTYNELSGIVLYAAAVAYSVQLYMDFSGCVDICRGVSKLFNIDLINNFNRPYLATSIKDFWSRWHISLSLWLRDYIYIPLGGNRRGTARKYLNLIITFLVSGLWHGAGLNFLVWGLLHALYQILEQSTLNVRNKLKQLLGVVPGSFSERLYQIIITFNLVTFAWIFFRAPDLYSGLQYVARMFSGFNFAGIHGQEFGYGFNMRYVEMLFLQLCVFFVVELCSESQDKVVDGLLQQHVFIRWLIFILMILDVCLLGVYGRGYSMSGFMYGGF